MKLVPLAVIAWSCSTFVSAQSTPPGSALSRSLDRYGVSAAEKEIIAAAEEMPESKYRFIPGTGEYSGVRDFAEQLRHVAQNNDFLAASILLEQAPAQDPAKLTTKADLIAYLKNTFDHLHRAVAIINETNFNENIKAPTGAQGSRFNMAIIAVGHSWDVYGQLVEYQRMAGVVPRASRPKDGKK